MPFTHSYSSSAIAARTHQSNNHNRGAGVHILGTPGSSTASIAASSSRIPSSPQSTTTADSAATVDHESTSRSRLFSSGRKSPDPFRRFRRLSSSNSLNIASAPPAPNASQSFDSQQSQYSAYTDTSIPAYPSTNRPAASPAPLATQRPAPPPLPSASTKPAFQRPKRTKSSSISILSTGLGLRNRDHRADPSSDVDVRRRHRKSASLSGSDADSLASALERAATPQPTLRAASPAPSLSGSLYSLNQETTSGSSLPLSPPLYDSKKHKQAWYQAQQKTIQLDNPHNREMHQSNLDNANLFPLNVAVPDQVDRARSSPIDSRSPRPAVETFLSEQEMLDAGIHIIRRRDDDTTTASASSKDSPGLATPRMHDSATMPVMPPRLYGAEHPDFLELIDSPINSKQPSPLLNRPLDPPIASANMHRALSHSRNKSSSGSLSISSASSTDHLPHDASSLNNGSTGSLSSGSKHSFSFSKLRRAGAKQSNAAPSSRPSTAESSSEDVTGSRTFLFPSRERTTSQQQQHQPLNNGSAAAPGYLTPGPGSSASPFLNKHSATVGRASRSINGGDTAKNGLAQVFSGRGSSPATVGPASSIGNPYHASTTNGVAPPKPSKPKPSLLAAFPRSGSASNSSLGSISAPNTATLRPLHDSSDKSHSGNGGDALLQPPASAGPGNGVYSNVAHARSQEAVAEARLDAEALRASAGTPMPPPRRLNPPRAGGAGTSFGYSQYTSPAMARSSSSGTGGVVGALGHVGQIGAAMGRKGWDFMKTLQTSNNAAATGPAANRSAGMSSGNAFGYRAGSNATAPAASTAENEPTRQWLMLLDGHDANNTRSAVGGVFGAPLQDAVLRSRLSSLAASEQNQLTNGSGGEDDHLGVPDLGQQFSANFLESPRVTPRASVAVSPHEPLSREEARHLYLPRVVVRCIESLEKWGPSEEGIYRISGRSSHTSKLRLHFSDPRNDLLLDQINPADLDINSVCSLLKSYLRELPEPLIPLAQSKLLDQAVSRLLSGSDSGTGAEPRSTGGGGKITDERAAALDSDKVASELRPLMRQLPIYNWYLLRELTEHLGMLAQPSVVASTKMPISNLTLVLAPTVSISLPLLQVMVRHREVVFSGSPEDVPVAAASVAAAFEVKKDKPVIPAKPAKMTSPSKLPVMIRKRASSSRLSALLSSPVQKEEKVQHQRRPSVTPSIELPEYLAFSTTAGRGEASERPSTSLGHFSELSSPSTRSNTSRDTSLRLDALALDDSNSATSTPIARYYARMRQEAAEEQAGREGARTPMMGNSTSMPSFSPEDGRVSALDRPRPPTSGQARFFAGRSRRQESSGSGDGMVGKSVSGLGLNSAIPLRQEGGETRPLRIVKKGSNGQV
ncbi:putative GTPase-activating protein BEM3 (putative) [Pseudozyma hubeiensis]|nr:putative GTPase-activating protein BEM3 (putative) [Pseudozyma hubeiensis]